MNNNPENKKIWRYMDFAKFINILSYGALYFPRLKVLLEDPYECTIPQLNLEELKNNIPKVENVEPEKYLTQVEAHVRGLCKERKNHIFVCSWHMNQSESYLMWNTYCKTQDSVAIISSTEKIQKAVEEKNKERRETLIAGQVNYIDFKKEKINDMCTLTAGSNPAPILNIGKIIFYKDIAFKSEQEYRVICDLSRTTKQFKREVINNSFGYIGVNLKNIIEEVYVHPQSESWFLDLVNRFVSQLGIEAKKSRLAKQY